MSFEDATSPSYWRSAWREFKPYATLDLIAEDNTWEARLRVISAVDGNIRFRVIYKLEAEKRKADIPKGYHVEHLSPNGWRVVGPDGSQIGSFEPMEADAVRTATDHARRSTVKA